MRYRSVLLLFMLFTCTLRAQDKQTGPHGGRLKPGGIYHIEAIGCDNYLEIYLYSDSLEPVHNYWIRGIVKFYYKDQETSSPMVTYGMDGFTTKIGSADFTSFLVHCELPNKVIITAKFDNECARPKPSK